MKLFLASLGITDGLVGDFKKLLEKNRHSREIPKGYIIENASDYKGKKGQLELRQYYKILRKNGIDYTFLDLKEYKGDVNKLKSKLDEADFIYISGGNVFYLYYWIIESGLSQILKDQLKNGLVYAGSSAGSVVVGETLKYLDLVDDINISPDVAKTVWKGLKLVNFVILPHWGEKKYISNFNIIKSKLEKDGYNVKTITNTQAVIVINNNMRLISEESI